MSYQLMQKARMAAATLFDGIAEVKLVEKSPSGEHHYHVTCHGQNHPVRVTVTEDSPIASVEWRKQGKQGTGDRIFRLQGIPKKQIVSPSESPSSRSTWDWALV
jgi:hypothetical protein